MITFEEAIRSIDAQNVAVFTVVANTNFAVGQISRDDICNNIMVPVIRNSAVDGYAVRYTTTRTVGSGNIVFLRVISYQDVNIYKDVFVAIEIMTGARIPYGFDAVVKVEDTVTYKHYLTKYVCISGSVIKNANVKVIGEDFCGGEIILRKNSVINISHVVVLCLFGFFFLRIFKLPRIAIFSTGDEISNCKNAIRLSSDTFITPTYFNNNGNNTSVPYVLNYFKALGIIVDYYGCYKDTSTDIFSAFRHIEVSNKVYDLVITTGAVSKGKKDFIRDVFVNTGGEVVFHGVRIKPGKPVLFGFNRSKGYYFFGLPGNVLASIVNVCFLVFYFIKSKFGIRTSHYINTISFDNVRVKRSFTYFVKTDIFYYRGILCSSIEYGQESFKLNSLLSTSALTIFPSVTVCNVYKTCPLYFNLS